MQSFISILLAVLMALSASRGLTDVSGDLREDIQAAISGAVASDEDVLVAEDAAEPAADEAPRDEAQTAPPIPQWEDVEYTHYDPADFYAMTDEMTELAAGEDAQAVLALYDELYAEYAHIDTLCTVAYLHYSADVTDEYWTEENTYCDGLAADAYDALCSALCQVTQGPCADAFAAHVGQENADAFAEYNAMSDRESEILAKESELVDQYFTLSAQTDELTYSYLGRTWTWDMITGFQGTSLSYQDYDGYLEVYYGLQEQLNEKLAPIYQQLVQLRREYAELLDYDSYAQMAYTDIFGRDYSPEDAQTLCDAVKEVGREYYDTLYYSDLWYESDEPTPILDGDGLVEALAQYAPQIDPSLQEAVRLMAEHGLYDLAIGDERSPTAYTITLSEYEVPFIFISLYGDCLDLSSAFHEFGHYIYDSRVPMPNILTSVGSYDLMEIHSTGLEMLTTEFYDDIFDDGADIARFMVLGSMLESVLEGCVQDEFQREVFARPDMTVDEMNRLFADIRSSYGFYEPMDVDYDWMYVTHTFDRPFYYISYAVSALASIQIWDLAQQDRQAGVDAWKAMLECDVFSDQYMDVLPRCGLRLFTEEGAVEDICAPLIRELDRLDAEA